jgi:hypothetical protein
MEISLKMISKLVILVLAIGSYLVGITQSVGHGGVENFQSYPQSYPPNDGQYTLQSPHWCCNKVWWLCCNPHCVYINNCNPPLRSIRGD